MYKLIAIDLDGTLLNSYGNVSSEDKTQVKRAVEQGVEVVLTSGRVTDSVENIAKEVGADRFLISGNGAIIFDFQENKPIYDRFIERKKALQIIKLCEENSIFYNIYTEDMIIAESLNYNVLFYHSENSRKPEGKKTNINIVKNIYEYVKEKEDLKISKITVCDESNIIFPRILEKIKKIKNVDVLEVAHMSRKIIKSGTEEYDITYYYSEISSQNVNKWTAIQFLIQKLGIQPEEVIAIGDNMNDISMLKGAGLGVAMANSAPVVKEVANIITKNNNENGVANVIQQYILHGKENV